MTLSGQLKGLTPNGKAIWITGVIELESKHQLLQGPAVLVRCSLSSGGDVCFWLEETPKPDTLTGVATEILELSEAKR